MSTTVKPNIVVVENTRRMTVRLADGVTAEQFVEALNKRRVKIDGNKLIDGYTKAELGERTIAVNAGDYRVSEHSPLPEFDTLDPYEFKYNEI